MRIVLVACLLSRCGPVPPLAPDGKVHASGLCSDDAPPAQPCREDVVATVGRVVDGDTLDVVLGGGTSRVRLIGIDAPESDEGDCGPLAEDHLISLAPEGAEVRLAFDAECLDAYGRDLAYVSAGDRALNAAMLRDGYAQPCPFEPNTTHADAFRCLGDRAAADGTGLWALGCNRDPCFH